MSGPLSRTPPWRNCSLAFGSVPCGVVMTAGGRWYWRWTRGPAGTVLMCMSRDRRRSLLSRVSSTTGSGIIPLALSSMLRPGLRTSRSRQQAARCSSFTPVVRRDWIAGSRCAGPAGMARTSEPALVNTTMAPAAVAVPPRAAELLRSWAQARAVPAGLAQRAQDRAVSTGRNGKFARPERECQP